MRDRTHAPRRSPSGFGVPASRNGKPAADAARRQAGPDLSGLSILLAEDRPRGRALADRLQGLGADVTLECSARSAFAAAMKRRHGGRGFDAVVLDLRQDPAETPIVAAALRRERFDGPVIAVAADPAGTSPPDWRDAGLTAVVAGEVPAAEVPVLLTR